MTCNGDCNQGRECICECKNEIIKTQHWLCLDGQMVVAQLYTTPPSREWQSLSDAEIWDIANFLGKNKEWDYPVMFAKTIEKALKEKNG